MSDNGAPAGYVEVHERIEAFYAKYPDGSLQSSWQMCDLGNGAAIVVEARAYRDANDNRPGVGLASEPVPGLTPFTKNSELMNAETSAWGRALAALGFKVKEGIASGNEVRSRSGGGSSNGGGKKGFATDKQRNFLERLLREEHGWPEEQIAGAADYLNTKHSGSRGGVISRTIDALKSDAPSEDQNKALAWLTEHVTAFDAEQNPDTPAPADPAHEAHDPSLPF